MASLPLLVPLVILIPSVGAFINFFWGHQLGERWSALIGQGAAILSFIIAALLFSYASATHGAALVVNPPLLDGWIRMDSIGLDIPWQLRVDTLSITMMLVVTGVGSLIHIYAGGYMHGDPKFARFFAFLNMFLAFMLTLVTANNFLMMFVGWEGVGLCSYLLIGFWWDKQGNEGWKNSNAARKAFVVNRIGDFGILMATFLIFWTFGTLNYYSPGETANVPYALERLEADHGAESHNEEARLNDGILLVQDAGEGEAEGDEAHGGHGASETQTAADVDNSRFEPGQLGVFNQARYMVGLPEGDPGRLVDFGTFSADIVDVLTLIVLFMLLGATGKSAQIPLFVWLPDAMAGPTPVSALIHAATMVTAGVYLMVRSHVFLDLANGIAPFLITIIGATTALMAGYIALGQWDIKRVLAYSTISQLGFMVAAVGLGAYVAAMFHLVTHAVFKALLFLGSGSVIHGVEHGHHHVHEHGHNGHDEHHHDDDEAFDPQDMRNMGGLSTRMPITYWTYLIGTLALAGIPPLAGFWSKDEILADAWHVGFDNGDLGGFVALGLLLVAAAFTAFYMWRQIEMVFHGQPRTEAARLAPESARSMTTPLVILAFFSVVIGFINVPEGMFLVGLFQAYEFKHFLEPSLVAITEGPTLIFNALLALLATGLGLGAIFAARSIYGSNRALTEDQRDPLEANPQTQMAFSVANARLWWDDIYNRFVEQPFNRLANFLYEVIDWRFLHDYFHDAVIKRGFDTVANLLSKPLDLGVIDGIVNGVGRVTSWLSGRLRTVQTGYVRTYAWALLLGVVAVIIVMLLPLLQNGA